MADRYRKDIFASEVDWGTILLYGLLVLMGWFNIYAAVYDESHASIFDLSQRYGMQMIWIGISAFIATVVLLIDSRYYHIWAYPIYWLTILVLIGVLFFGKEVNGARSWITIGPIALQPTEFVKFTASLAIARYMSSYSFNIHSLSQLLSVGALLVIPVGIVLLQNDTGSALVYGSFLFMLFREGFNVWFYVVLILVVTLFLLSFLLEPALLLVLVLLSCVVAEGCANGYWREKVIYLCRVALLTLLLYVASAWFFEEPWSFYLSLIVGVAFSLVWVAMYAYRYRLQSVLVFILLFFCSFAFTKVIDYVFYNVMQIHQQKRILDLLGIESDLRHWGYNVNQSKIAIGSGGFSGKGFLEGTQTKFDFVPEQSTDFIFCTVGEEWGFLGTTVVVVLFALLILRLIKMGERQQEPFGRIYCYCVASILFFHVLVNIGMTIGLMPVIGIPLPFFSYGGSSLIAFTLLLFVAIKLDTTKHKTTL